MIWESWSAFWHMGGAGLFVWGSYALTFVLIVLELFLLVRRRKDTLRRLIRLRRANGGASRNTASTSSQ